MRAKCTPGAVKSSESLRNEVSTFNLNVFPAVFNAAFFSAALLCFSASVLLEVCIVISVCLTGCHLKAIYTVESLNTDSSLQAKWQPTRSHCACVTQPRTTTVRLEIGKTIISSCAPFPPFLIYFSVSWRPSWITYSSNSERDNRLINLWMSKVPTVMENLEIPGSYC